MPVGRHRCQWFPAFTQNQQYLQWNQGCSTLRKQASPLVQPEIAWMWISWMSTWSSPSNWFGVFAKHPPIRRHLPCFRVYGSCFSFFFPSVSPLWVKLIEPWMRLLGNLFSVSGSMKWGRKNALNGSALQQYNTFLFFFFLGRSSCFSFSMCLLDVEQCCQWRQTSPSTTLLQHLLVEAAAKVAAMHCYSCTREMLFTSSEGHGRHCCVCLKTITVCTHQQHFTPIRERSKKAGGSHGSIFPPGRSPALFNPPHLAAFPAD